MADKLFDKIQLSEQVLERYRGMQGAVVVMVAITILIGWTFIAEGPLSLALRGGLAYALVLVLYLEMVIRRRRKRSMPDRLALREVLQLLRESERVISMIDHWSTLQKAEYRIRISRFGVE